MGLYDNIDKMWFGTERKAMWIDTPNTGADASSVGVSVASNLLNGGGYVRNSWDSNKQYQFSWGESASQELVSAIQAYRNGSYGRGLLYFLDPMYYRTNVLPKRWSDPAMAVNYEAEPLVRDANPRATPQVSTQNNYPIDAATYTLPAGYSSEADGTELYLPIPPGFSMVLGSVHSGGGEVYYRTQAGTTPLTPMALDDAMVTNTVITDQPWVRLGVRNTGASPTAITLGGMTARVALTVTADLTVGPWYSGEGHSGCRFDGDVTVINYSGVAGGRIGLAANLKEVGAWE